MYTQDFNPVSDSLGLTAIFAVLPMLTLFVLLGGLKMKAQWAALISLGVAMLVALIVYGMPVGPDGCCPRARAPTFGLFPIMWIVDHGDLGLQHDRRDRALRRAAPLVRRDLRRPARPGRDHRVLLRRAARGARRLRHARGDHRGDADRARLPADQGGLAWRSWPTPRPVAFGAIATPIITLADVTELHKDDLGAMVGRQTPFLALIVPLILIVHGRRQARHAPGLAGGRASAAPPSRSASSLCANYFSVELTDIVASLLATASIVAFLRVWSPGRAAPRATAPADASAGRPWRAARCTIPTLEREIARRDDTRSATRTADVVRAYAPYADHHRRLLDRADPGGQGRARRVAVDDHVPVARAWTWRPRTARPLAA